MYYFIPIGLWITKANWYYNHFVKRIFATYPLLLAYNIKGANKKGGIYMEIRPKGLEAFLEDDPGLQEKFTYEDYQQGKINPDNSDQPIEKVYKEYRTFLTKGTVK